MDLQAFGGCNDWLDPNRPPQKRSRYKPFVKIFSVNLDLSLTAKRTPIHNEIVSRNVTWPV